MPRLWTDTIEAHREAVRDATLDATARLVAEHGLASVTMSQIAEETGIGRATLYKYFSDVDAILVAWHERHIGDHVEELIEVRDRVDGPAEQLHAVLEAYALIRYQVPRSDLAAALHRGEHIERAQRRLRQLVRDLVTNATRVGAVRDDLSPDELTDYCLHALEAANTMTSKAAVGRLVAVTLSGMWRSTGSRGRG